MNGMREQALDNLKSIGLSLLCVGGIVAATYFAPSIDEMTKSKTEKEKDSVRVENAAPHVQPK